MEHTQIVQILVADDDPSVRDSLRRSLSFNGYSVTTAEDGAETLVSIAQDPPDALILDINMPVLDGLETCRRLRASGNDLPVLMLTARDDVRDRVLGLDAGADDYLPKPFALEELLARVRALLRRSPAAGTAGSSLSFGDLALDLNTREVTRGTRKLTLTRTEFSLLELLLQHPRRVLTRAQILDEVWGYNFPTTANSLEVYVGYLRRKTETDGEPRLIHTVRGVGYVLKEGDHD
jgi:two-component system, OmpR family, response regulator MprA